jgi:RNA polymerase sigma factor (sigma-70 family)
MAEKKYYIRVPEALVEVTEDVYTAFWTMDRHAKTLEEKDTRNHVFSYDALDTDDMLGAELFPDQSSSSMEDQVIAKMMAAKLRRCIALLPEEDRKLIQAIYYDGLSEREVAKRDGIPRMTIKYRLGQIVQKLQNLIK